MRRWFVWDVLTNAAYPLAALAVARDSPAGYVFVGLMTLLGIASTLYHAGVPRAVHLDMMGIYAVGVALWLVTILGTGVPTAIAMPAAIPAAYLLRMKQLDVRMEVKVGALFGVLYATAFLFHGFQWEILASVAIVGMGLVLRPRNHALWHLVSAYGLALLWIGVTA